MAMPSAAQRGGIYTCVDDRGRRITSDRPIPECLEREQRILNRDGSLKSVRPPALTPEERARKEAREREAARLRAEQADAERRDRNLLQRYADEPEHARARDAALAPVRSAQRATQERMAQVSQERQRLLVEAEFFRGRPLPARLQAQLDASEASLAALRLSAAGQEAEAARINRLYDVELQRLRRLWAGEPPGSLGPLEPPGSAPPAAAAPQR